jgi:hypothetical protein
VDPKLDFEDDVQTVPGALVDFTREPRVAAKSSIDLRAVRLDGTWQASSFDLAQGCDVKEMESKLSPETLDRLFRG